MSKETLPLREDALLPSRRDTELATPQVDGRPATGSGVSASDLATTIASSGSNGVPVDPGAELVIESNPDERYERIALIGEGGMGEVRLCKDQRFGREVAMKVVRAGRGAHGDLRARFLREARVQGQLEHPAIVPAYDLGRDAQGNLFFTMKRLRGSTLEEILERLRTRDADTGAQYTRHKLLTAFLDVCQAVHFAHVRGVIHRDLKPSNVMLGSYGEVYVLDWGLAKIAGHQDPLLQGEVDVGAAAGAQTAVGAVMGTPGYMAPEQARGQDDLDARADVYALGAILFEILTLQPLSGDGTAAEILSRTLKGADARPSARAPDRDVAPELEAICVRATALRREDRYATARELHDAVERFLSGDRDVERRNALAADHADRASAAADRALSAQGTLEDRTEALREVGRALALDPANTSALDVFVRLTSAPPRQIPNELAAQLEAQRADADARGMRFARRVYALMFAFVPLMLLMGIRSTPLFVVFIVGWSVLLLCTYVPLRRADWVRTFMLLLVATEIGLASAVFGPLVVVPVLTAAHAIGSIVLLPPKMHPRIIAFACLSVLVPFALDLAGLVPPAYSFTEVALVVHARGTWFHAPWALVFLVLGNLVALLGGCWFASRYQRLLQAAEERNAIMTWQLRQLAPAAGRMLRVRPPDSEKIRCVL
jgi:serine/threonine-protein kinase